MIWTGALWHFRWDQGVCDQNGAGCSIRQQPTEDQAPWNRHTQYLPAISPPGLSQAIPHQQLPGVCRAEGTVWGRIDRQGLASASQESTPAHTGTC